ncbi:MAG TPA: EAL domain-containing protein [Gammaproteobacteria bacterium]|nr:EAL domain-containing protein [Gammaproteobacteria bacterium]
MDKLLILDDEVTIAQTIATIAELAGLEARITTSPAEFFRQLEEWQPTRIALDLVMPEMDGVQVMAELSRRGCRARIIITSGVGSRVLDAAGRSAAEHGLRIAGMLSKPFSPAALRSLLLDTEARSAGRAPGPAGPDIQLRPEHLRQALAERQLYLVYQPQIACASGAVTGFEALVRWAHPEFGTIMPDRFIPMAESAGLIDDLTDQVLELGLAWLSRSFPNGTRSGTGSGLAGSEVTLSVNMSAGTLGDRDFVEDALRVCRRHAIDPARLILELTETSAMRDPVASLDQLTRMRMKSFQLSIDDFGTGFSSMLQLARLPFSEIKVDKSFVMTAMQSMESRAVVRSILDLGASLGLRTVAEGVEDSATLEFLKGIGCDIAQGYFISRPIPGDDVAGWIAARQSPAARSQRRQTAALRDEPVQSFPWDDTFRTGIPDVDQRHERMVELLNRLEHALTHEDTAALNAEVDTLVADISGYTAFHFQEEESMMAELNMDARHIEQHRREHAAFLAEVRQLHATTAAESRREMPPLLAYLMHSLAYHVLRLDQSMSRQVAAMRNGKSPAEAYAADGDLRGANGEPLVQALEGLYQMASRRNRDLHDAKLGLEQSIIERTAALSEANRQLAVMAMTDFLTGIPNRRHALATLDREWGDPRSDAPPVACLMIDADNLKLINDAHGHAAGDDVLKGLALKLRDAIRSDDVACRLGGDEFFVIAPTTTMEGALRLAEKIRRDVSELRIPAGDTHWHGSVSIGVAVRDETMSGPDDLLKAADTAAYAAKHAGRNLIATQNGPVEPAQS